MDGELMRVGLISIVAGTALFTVVLGAILAYHWKKFAMNKAIATLAIVLYACVSIVLLSLLWSYIPVFPL